MLSQTGSLLSFIREFKRLIQQLHDTPRMPSSGGIIERCLEGLQAPTANYLNKQAPVDWRSDLETSIDKALHDEINLCNANIHVHAAASVNSPIQALID